MLCSLLSGSFPRSRCQPSGMHPYGHSQLTVWVCGAEHTVSLSILLTWTFGQLLVL